MSLDMLKIDVTLKQKISKLCDFSIVVTIVVVKESGNISLENLYQAATLFSIGDNPLL